MNEYFDFKLEEQLKKKGTKEMGMIRIAQRPNGSWINIPVLLAVGAKEGPVVLADGCNHGDEYEGCEGIIEAFYSLDVNEMAGAFIGVPAVNMEAFAEMSRYNTTDFVPQDLNRIYPGGQGPMTAYICQWYCENILKKVNAIITCHGGGNCEYLEPVVLYCGEDSDVARTSKEMAEVFGFKVLWKNTRYAAGSGIEDEYGYEIGVPSITPEIGGQCTRMYQREEHKQMVAQGIRNVLTYFHVLDGEVKKTEGAKHYDIDYIYNRNGGIHTPVKKAMDEVKAGDTLSIITNVFGEEVDRVIAPFDGVVIGYWTYSVCQPHGWLYMVGKPVEG
jgi:predicted deacylase